MNDFEKVHALDCIVTDLIQNARSTDFCGFDPFDGLNSRIFKALGLSKIPLASIVWLQFHKRSPVNLWRLVGVERARNPKGIALFILGFLQIYQHTRDKSYLNLAVSLGDWLLTAASEKAKWRHFAWGYHFDWVARAFFVLQGQAQRDHHVLRGARIIRIRRRHSSFTIYGSCH